MKNHVRSNSIPRIHAQQVSRTGSFDLLCGVETAFPLFGPEGERSWVKGWDPRPVFPDAVAFQRDTVFREGHEGEEALWTIVEVNWTEHRAEYVRFAPASHSAHIVVQVEPNSADCSHVVVQYVVTAFGPSAEAQLESFSETKYAERMRNWQSQISAYLGSMVG